MKRTNPIYWSILLLFLAACGTDGVPEFSGDSAQVRIVSSLTPRTTDLSLQGVPIDPETGQSGVTRAVLEVFDNGSDKQLFFKDGQVVSEADAQTVTLTLQDSSAALALPPGTYSFLLTALDEREPANELAFGVAEGVEVAGADQEIRIRLGSYVGSAVLEVPETVQANAVFDAFLEVSPPGRPDLRVPEGDYAVSYEVDAPSQQLSESQLGVRVAAACEEVKVRAVVASNAPRTGGARGQARAQTSVPIQDEACGGSGNVGADLVPPFVAINKPEEGADVDTNFTLSGDVNDQQSGIERVEVYEGTVKLGEAQVNSGEMTWHFDVSLGEGAYALTAVAFDKAGNTQRQEVNVTVKGDADNGSADNGSADNGDANQGVDIPDDILERTVREALDKPEGKLTKGDLASLTELTPISPPRGPALGQTFNVESLEGLQFARNLEVLNLPADNRGSLSDLSPLSNLTKLREINLNDQKVRDLSPLANLTNLEVLTLLFNDVEDLSSLANLTNLVTLNLAGNQVRDLSALVDLTDLDILDLDLNAVRDLRPLLDNEGLGEGGDKVSVNGNCFDPAAPDVLEVVEQLEARDPGEINFFYDELEARDGGECV